MPCRDLKKERLTCQKKAVMEFLENNRSHPSAEDIYQAVRKRLPQISRATVYRIVRVLKEKGEIREIPLEPARYDARKEFHFHFVCLACGRVEDIRPSAGFAGALGKEEKRASKVGRISYCEALFYGKCKKCQRQEKS